MSTMRPKSNHRDLPPKMLRRVRTLKNGKVWEAFYYNGRDAEGRRVEIPLGQDLNEAKRKWAALEYRDSPAETGLMRFIFDRYERDVIPAKATRTQKDNREGLAWLRKVFDAVGIDTITPQYVAQYRDKRGSKAPVRANREIALLSHVWNMAREWGYTALENPVKGVRKNKETPRDFYADDAVYSAVYSAACTELQDAMDLNYITGQRPADVIKMRLADIKGGAMEVLQNKTKKKLRILLDDAGRRTELGMIIDRIKARERKVASVFLVASVTGSKLSTDMLQERFAKARAKAAENCNDEALAERIKNFQFRDIRPKAASETDLGHAQKLLGHTDKRITETVYRRVGETVMPLNKR